MALTRVNGNLISSGTITGNLFNNNTITGDKIAAATIGSSNLTTTGVSAGVYGGTGNTVSLIVDAQGRVTSAANVASAGGGTPGGSTTQVQYNNAGAFAGSSNFNFDGSRVLLGLTSNLSGARLQVQGGTDTAFTALTINASTNDAFMGIGYSSSGSVWQIFPSYQATAGYKPLAFMVGGSEVARFPTASGFQCVNSISVGNATPTTSGAGITFPATQSSSTNANTLDDYEEGTFTPSLTGSSGGAGTYSVRDGIYVKVGKMVTLNFWIYCDTKNTLNGNITLTGLPFASSSTASFSGYRPSPSLRTTALLSVTGIVGGWMSSSSTAINLQIFNNGTATAELNATNLPTVLFEIGGTLSYITD